MVPYVFRIWRASAKEPAKTAALDVELILDRDFLGTTDGFVSRATNAPGVGPTDTGGAFVNVPTRSGSPVFVFEELDFDALQAPLAPPSEPWKVAPAELADRTRVVRGERATLAFVQQLHRDRPGPTFHLMLLPPSRCIRQGQREEIRTPAIVMVGSGAVEVRADNTEAADQSSRPMVTAYGVEPPDFQHHYALATLFDRFPNHEASGPLEVPLHSAPISSDELPIACAALLRLRGRLADFIPVLDSGHLARLALAYTRADGSVGAVLSDPEIRGWLTELGRIPRSPSLPTRPPPELFLSSPDAGAAEPPLARFGSIETKSRAFATVLERLATIGPGNADLILLGETGSGKEHVARAVHASSPRRNGPFVAVNCALETPDLLESLLFGHVKGAFTGAVAARKGKLMEADGGTLLLDEIGDCSVQFQRALLRALETRCFTPVGATGEVRVDVRVLAATSRDLDEMVAKDQFRPDLFYRLGGGKVVVPPLRERLEDLPALCQKLLARIDDTLTMSDAALALLGSYDWPGNVRELITALDAAAQDALIQRVRDAARAGADGRSDGAEATGRRTELLPQHFDFVRQSSGAPPVPQKPFLFFSDEAKAAAAQALRNGALPATGDQHRNKTRATHRVALLYLSTQHPRAKWPPVLRRVWNRLFGPVWDTTEEGRGMYDLLTALSVDRRDDEAVRKATAWIVERVGSG